MSIASLEQVKGMLRSMFGVADKGIARAQAAADKAQETAAGKMDANNPTGTGSFSMGRRAGFTIGQYSHAEGYWGMAQGKYSHAEGWKTNAEGEAAHAEGYATGATGNYSHAEGYNSRASGAMSHAEGASTASGAQSHAEGASTAKGSKSHAEGEGTVAAADRQHVQGKWNIEDTEGKYQHIVGNGTSGVACSNAHTLDWDGNAWYAGTVEGTALILTSPNGTRYQITVDDTGALTAAAL